MRYLTPDPQFQDAKLSVFVGCHGQEFRDSLDDFDQFIFGQLDDFLKEIGVDESVNKSEMIEYGPNFDDGSVIPGGEEITDFLQDKLFELYFL